MPLDLNNCHILGDAKRVLELVPDNVFHLTFTSPPYYNARDYSVYDSYEEYLHILGQVFSLIYHKTKSGRFLIVNTSPVISPRKSRQHESKRHPIPFDLNTIIQNIGWEFIDDIIWVKPEPSVKNRNAGFLQHRKPIAYKPNAVTEYLFVYRKRTTKLIDHILASYDHDIMEASKIKDGFESTNIWRIPPAFSKNHPAIFPLALCKRVIEYYSIIGDLILDPFSGNGTLGKAAKSLDRNFFMIEKNQSYYQQTKQDFANEIFQTNIKNFTCKELNTFINL